MPLALIPEVDEKQTKQEAARKALLEKRVVMYSTYPEPWLGFSHDKRVQVKMVSGEYDYVTQGQHLHLQFGQNRCMFVTDREGTREPLTVAHMPRIRKLHGYGRAFMEGAEIPDGEKNAMSLEKIRRTQPAVFQAFCKEIERLEARRSHNVPVQNWQIEAELAAQKLYLSDPEAKGAYKFPEA